MKKIILIAIQISLNLILYSQDLHFSQFNENPSLINPALTGATNSIRASIINKNQWRSVTTPYKTMGASFEARFKSDSWQDFKSRSMTAFGLSIYKDKAGTGNLGLTLVNFSLANFLAINKKNFISVGLQGTMAQRMIDNTKLLFPSQYNGNIYDPNQISNENFTNLKFTYFDLGAGAQWTYTRKKKNMDFYKQFNSHLGFAVYHLMQPSQEFLGTLSKLYIKYVTHGDLIASIGNSNMALSPSYLIQFQGTSKEIIIGTTLRHYRKSESKYTGFVLRDCIGYGLYYRSKDAIIFSLLLEWQEKLALLMSYDLNISRLSSSSSFRGGFELTLRYTTPKSFFYKRKESKSTE